LNIPVFKAEGRTVGRTRFRLLEGGENGLRELRMRTWRKNEDNIEEWASVLKGFKVLRGL
jgi:hypothetical protein